MKRILALVLALLLLTLAGCGSDISDDTSGYTIDYNDATSFESALNDGEKVKNKIVQFYVNEYVPDSILGINCHAGEHLNFLFEEELDVNDGDTIIVRVTEEASKVFLLGSWKVPCELLEINESVEETEDETISNNSENENENPEEITLTMSSSDFKGMNYKEAEKKLKEMGFTNFEYETVEAKDKSTANKISYIEITEFIFGESDFKKGDKFNSDSTIALYYYEYEEPEKSSSLFYSTNDYETATKGNTGVFSYKNKSGSYDVYWIIDLDAKYVYFFTDGNGENTCDKVKITAGDLNDRITATWHDGGDQWSWYLHFKYKNHPETLVVNDHNGFATEFRTTDLDDALSVRDSKKIKNY